jgi:hypothetical protein
MKLMTALVLGCLLALWGCSSDGEEKAKAPSPATEKRLSLADACAEVAAMDNSLRTSDEEYAVAMRDIDALIDRAEPSAVAALTTIRDAYAAQINAAPGDASADAFRQELQAFEQFAQSCQTVGSPIE